MQRKTAEFMIAVLDELGYMAYNVGGNDLAFGLEWVQSLANKAQVPFLSANILDSDGDLAFRPYIEEKVGRRKFGIVGICSVPNYELTGGSVGDPIEALKKYVIEIRDKVDFIIVLAAVSDAEETQILQTGLPVDLILRAATYRFSHSIITENDMMVSRLGNIGKYLGRIQITIHDPRQPIADASKLRSQLEYVGKRLSSFSKHIGNQSLEEYYKDRPNIVNIVRSLQEHQVKLEKELREIVNPVDFELIALDKNIADDPEMRRLIDEHKEKYNIQAPQ